MNEAENGYLAQTQGYEPSQDEREIIRSIVGTSEIFIGLGLIAGGIHGIDTHEAASTSTDDTLGSMTLDVGEGEVFVTPADIGFGALALIGSSITALGIRTIRRRAR